MRLYAHVIMENHIHRIASSLDISKTTKSFKSFTVRRSWSFPGRAFPSRNLQTRGSKPLPGPRGSSGSSFPPESRSAHRQPVRALRTAFNRKQWARKDREKALGLCRHHEHTEFRT
jgi:REP element-mobilizing transposase RayT